MLDLQRLAVLREFALQGTVARTAEQLNFTPSAISQQLAQLQREAGVSLFRHVGRRLELTDAGTLLVARGEELIARLGSIEAELEAQAGTVSGTIRVAAFQTAARFMVLPAIQRLSHDYGDLTIELVEAEAEEAIPALARRELDVVVAEEYATEPRPRSAGIARRDLVADELLIALPAAHPAATRTKQSLRLAALATDEWVTARSGTAYAEMVVGLCRSTGGFEPAIRHRANDLQLMLDTVSRMRAVAIVPALGRPGDHSGIATRRIAGSRHARTIFAALRESDAVRPSVGAVVGALAADL